MAQNVREEKGKPPGHPFTHRPKKAQAPQLTGCGGIENMMGGHILEELKHESLSYRRP
jgi:hypothetical protein